MLSFFEKLENVVSELQFLGVTLQTAYGVIGDGLFEDMFVDIEERRQF